ncbi:MAG TPA: hypothetical protein VHV75_00575 [Solirubrobacteraceae bacterium]|jgi:hypothetical protein|nr:hypothetical protein [Solirubrobacteraceae bacterium]
MPKNHSRFTRLARFALILSAAALFFTSLAGTGIASAKTDSAPKRAHAAKKSHATKKAHDAGTLPAEGMFDSCNIGSTLNACEQDLQKMHQAGLQVAVVGMQWYSQSQLSAYTNYAQGLGMSVMWEINDPGFWGGQWNGSSASNDFPQFSAACGCTDAKQVLNYMVQWLGALPATYGFYAADDELLTPGERGGLTQYVDEIKADAPGQMVMVGSSQSQGTTYASTGATIGNQIYPETTDALMPYGSNLAAWDSVQQSVTQDQHAATTHGTQSAFILQAFSFGDSLIDGEDVGVCTASMSQAHCASLLHYPSASTQLELRNEVLEHSQPKLILWYTYGQTYGQGDRWSGLTSAVRSPYPTTASAARAKHSKSHKKVAKAKKKTKKHTVAV